MTKEMWEVLNTDAPPEKSKELAVVEPIIPQNEDMNKDFEESRKMIRSLMDKGNDALDDLLDIARQEQSPRLYEVAANLIKTLNDSAMSLQAIHEKKHKMDQPDVKGLTNNEKNIPNKIQVDKAVFVGTSSDLLDHIRAKKNG